MSNRFEDLPTYIKDRIMSFLREVDGTYEAIDERGFVDFVYENSATYPALMDLIQVNEAYLTKRIEETGEIPPGIKAIRTTTVEGSNVKS
jgi:hypothetical protein